MTNLQQMTPRERELMAVGMMMSDLASCGFKIQRNIITDEIKVFLSARPVLKAEVESVLWGLGYQSCQFELSKDGQAAFVKAII